MIPVARAPTALLVTDNLAAWTLRRPSAKQCSDRATTPAWGLPWKSVAQARFQGGLFSTADCKSVALICRVAAVRFDSFSPHQLWFHRLSVRIGHCHCPGTGSTPVGTAKILGYEPKGRGFESCQWCQITQEYYLLDN